MPNAKVCVVIPNYNHASYLRDRIDSVLNQTFRDIHVLVMDDCSTDNSLEVINEYRNHPNVSIVVNETNSGNTFAQWEKGVNLTRSDYVWIAESDDWAEPTFLETMVAKLDSHPNAGMAVCESLIIDKNGRELGLYLDQQRQLPQFKHYDFASLTQGGCYTGSDYLKKFMVPFNTVPNASAVLFRRSSIEGRIEPTMDMRLCGDWLIYCRILMQHDIARVALPLNHFRRHGANVRSNTRTIDFLRQQRVVRSYVRSQLGSVGQRCSVLVFESQLLVASRRNQPNQKVPLQEARAALMDSCRFGFGLFCAVLILLTKEQIASLVRPFRRNFSLH